MSSLFSDAPLNEDEQSNTTRRDFFVYGKQRDEVYTTPFHFFHADLVAAPFLHNPL